MSDKTLVERKARDIHNVQRSEYGANYYGIFEPELQMKCSNPNGSSLEIRIPSA